MWVKQCHKPPMTGNGNHTTYKHGDLGMVYGIGLTTFYENETKTDISWYSDIAILHSFVGMRHDGRMPPEIQSQTLEKLWMFNVHACVWENLYYISF